MSLFKWVTNLFGSNTDTNTEELETVRTRDSKGRFIKDDPNTPENEAFTTRKKKRKSK